MNKKEIVKAVADKYNEFSQKEITMLVDAFLDQVVTAVASGEKVSLAGFGTFEPVRRASHDGRNPATGGRMTFPERTIVKFKSLKAFRDAVNS